MSPSPGFQAWMGPFAHRGSQSSTWVYYVLLPCTQLPPSQQECQPKQDQLHSQEEEARTAQRHSSGSGGSPRVTPQPLQPVPAHSSQALLPFHLQSGTAKPSVSHADSTQGHGVLCPGWAARVTDRQPHTRQRGQHQGWEPQAPGRMELHARAGCPGTDSGP